MTRTEERLADALGAAARGVPAETMRPLIVPEPRRRRPGWLAPAAAAAGVTLAVGLAVALGSQPSRSGHAATSTVSPPPTYYVEVGIAGGQPVVRSTATGAVTATVPVPAAANTPGTDIVAPAAGGTFLVAAPGASGQRLYRFGLTGAGQVSGFAAVPGGALSGRLWASDAIAASPDGSQVAVALDYVGPQRACGSKGQPTCPRPGAHPDYIVVVNTATGAKRVWRGGTASAFSVASLSWTVGGRELVYLGQSCGVFQMGSEHCGNGTRTAEVRALDPGSAGGRLDSGPVLLSQSARFPYIAQALISPDGSTLTALVLRDRVIGTKEIGGAVPSDLAIEQISVTTGKRLGVLYQRRLGSTPEVNIAPDFLALSQDGAGQHWMLNGGICSGHGCGGGFDGWINGGRLVPLQPADGRETDQAW